MELVTILNHVVPRAGRSIELSLSTLLCTAAVTYIQSSILYAYTKLICDSKKFDPFYLINTNYANATFT